MIDMRTRKLVKSGYSSLVVAVPKEWIDRNKLHAGDLVYVDDKSDRLSISTTYKDKPVEKREIVINVDGRGEKSIIRDLTRAYLDNYFYITLKGKELSKYSKAIKAHITQLIALELVEESSDSIVARSFLDVHDIDIKLLIRRMDNIVRSMIIDLKTISRDPLVAQNIVDRDVEVNKLCFMTFKVLKTAYTDKKVLESLNMKDMDILKYWEVNIHLEKIADRVKNIAKKVGGLNKEMMKRFLSLFDKIEEMYKDCMTAFYKSSLIGTDEIAGKKIELYAEVDKYLKQNTTALAGQIAIDAYNMCSHINDIARAIRYLD